MGIYTIVAAGIAFAVTALSGKWMVPFLQRLKYGQTIKEIGPTWHKKKQGTPTMGGLMFIIGVVCAILIAVPLYFEGFGTEISLAQKTKVFGGTLMAVGFALIGFFDDYIKVVKKQNLGLTARQKFLLQCLVGAAYLFSLYMAGERGMTLIPFVGYVDLGIWYWPLALLVIVGTVNAVNLTDGIDGLASSVTFVAAVFFMLIATVTGVYGISTVAAAVAGGCVGFLLWNFHPAKVFMGDTGSLFLGGLIVLLGFGIGMPILILPIGIVYFLETLSVVLQVLYFKATHGKRICKLSPIHHHFEMCGWSEIKIVCVFSFITMLGCIGAVLCVVFGL